ncbi:MAG: hypothetical protein PVG24_01660 [Gammaproteobacteria bacterium]|jgi:hypothetical protein
MEFAEYPLLNTPHLTVVILKTAADGPARLDDAVGRLRDVLRQAGEDPPFDDATLSRRLRAVGTYLANAGLLQVHSGNRFVITDSGLRAIRHCPEGFDMADLVDDAEVRRRLRADRRQNTPTDPRNDQYADGFNAYRKGRRITENPFRQDTVWHLAWEDGWCEGRDSLSRTPAERRMR